MRGVVEIWYSYVGRSVSIFGKRFECNRSRDVHPLHTCTHVHWVLCAICCSAICNVVNADVTRVFQNERKHRFLMVTCNQLLPCYISPKLLLIFPNSATMLINNNYSDLLLHYKETFLISKDTALRTLPFLLNILYY